MNEHLIIPDWPVPNNIRALSTSRYNGFSLPPYHSLNLATHVNDSLDTVHKNRTHLIQTANLPASPCWLDQVHSNKVINSCDWHKGKQADAIVSSTAQHICTIMTADCLPILLSDRQGNMVAAIHAGWRGIVANIIEQTVKNFTCLPQDIMVWFGPAIGPDKFKVGSDVYKAFCDYSSQADKAFTQIDSTHYLADIYLLAAQRFKQLGIFHIFGAQFCTVTENKRFFSYRREGVTGRMASMIWIDTK